MFQLCVRSMAQVECIGPIQTAMKIRRDSIALACEALSKMFDRGEEELVSQVHTLTRCVCHCTDLYTFKSWV